VAQYLIRRVLLIVPTMLFVVAIVFLAMRILPTDIADLIVNNAGVGGAAYSKQAIRQQLNLDKPLAVQLALYTEHLLHGDLGRSAYNRKPVIEEIGQAFPVTLELTILAMSISTCLAILVGVTSAVKQDTLIDYVVRVSSILAFSAPVFWVATILIVFPAVWWHYFPPIFYIPFLQDPLQNLQQFIVPAIALALALFGSVARLVRSSLLEVLRQDYVRTAWAKGLSSRTVLVRHALKNALIPVVTFLGLQLSALLGGTVLIESIFGLPGLGSLTINAVNTKDYPVVQGTTLVFAAIVALVNLATDISYGLIDPRLKRV
jgi:peptide/nickel transport system permease protein